ncbi:YnfA family protein [Paracoccus ravus]|uniref:YnfA family protein n=1 Tax=Paracoccus ravus TaxID=2447760 RepID=UPI00106E752F|nr:YnfA family protein [Paracoccus ravus]
MTLLAPLAIYLLAALAEIAGCFAFWAWLRLGRSALWLLPGMLSLALFAWLLTRIDVDYSGRVYAAYGGIYVLTCLGWLWLTEGQIPTRWDLLGGGLFVLGTVVVLVGARG